jgi:predicted alpha/beta superfamily hydrolase
MHFRTPVVFMVTIFILSASSAFSFQAQHEQRYPPFTLRDTEVRPITSEAVKGMEYRVVVTLPEGYETSTGKYPTVYFLDAWAGGGLIIDTYRLLRMYDEIEPLLLIGISWEGTMQDWLQYRSRDYIPTHIAPKKLAEQFGQQLAGLTPASGGASNFLRFLRDELIPFVETKYRADPSKRALFGFSYGGLFSTWVLFNTPELFSRYLIGSPALFWDDYMVLKKEPAPANVKPRSGTKVFLSVGSLEGESIITSWVRLRDGLSSGNYAGVDLSAVMFEGETHNSVIPATFSRAFRILYGR